MEIVHQVFIQYETETNQQFEKRINDYINNNINFKDVERGSLMSENNGKFVSIYYELPKKSKSDKNKLGF